MALSILHNASLTQNNVDIVAIPAIGAEPRETFLPSNGYSWLSRISEELPEARIFLYDHLQKSEREAEIKPRGHADHTESVSKYADFRKGVEKLGINDWATRLLKELAIIRGSKELQQRPIIFFCHSTGGNVLKAALVKKLNAFGDAAVSLATIGITFFATPHHGSYILSEPQFVRAVQKELHLKFEMSSVLREEFFPESAVLDAISHDFESGALGVNIYNYIETLESQLYVLTGSSGEDETKVSYCIVDSHSAELKPDSVTSMIESRDLAMKSNHVGTARFTHKDRDYEHRSWIKELVRSARAQDRENHLNMIRQIKDDIKIVVCQFYEVDHSPDQWTAVWKEDASLDDFLQKGPERILKKRTAPKSPPPGRVESGSVSFNIPQFQLNPMPAPPAPMIRIYSTDSSDLEVINPRPQKAPELSAPSISINIINQSLRHTRRPSMPGIRSHSLDNVIHEAANRRPSLQVGLFPSQANENANHQSNPEIETAPQRSYTYQTPSKQKDKFQWIHVPACIPGLVPSIMTTVGKDKGNADVTKNLLGDTLWSSKHNRSHNASSHARFVKTFYKLLQPKSGMGPDGALSPASSIAGEARSVLFMPYLHWDTDYQRKARSAVINDRWQKAGPRPIADDVRSSSSLEHKLIWQFLNKRQSDYHCRRTLDQYGYPSLRNTEARDIDQVMFKQTKDQATAYLQSYNVATILMVDQLWLWVIDSTTVLTFFPSKEQGPKEFCPHTQADVFANIYRDVNGYYATELHDAFDFAALVVENCILALLEEDHHMLQVFPVFATYISELAEEYVISFKQFRKMQTHKVDHKNTGSGPSLDNGSDLHNLLELRDIEDELQTIKKLLDEQQRIVKDMMAHYKELNARNKGLIGIRILQDVHDNKLDEYMREVSNMLQEARSASKSYSQLLDMKARHNNILEAQLARNQAELAAEQSRSVMIFTIITIVFLPLSFFSSVFGMNVSDWSGTSTNLPLNYVVEVMACVSLAVIIVAILTAFNHATRKLVMAVSLYGRRLLKIPWRILAALAGKILPARYNDTYHGDGLPYDKGLSTYLPQTAIKIATAPIRYDTWQDHPETLAKGGSRRDRRRSRHSDHHMNTLAPDYQQDHNLLGIHKGNLASNNLIGPRSWPAQKHFDMNEEEEFGKHG